MQAWPQQRERKGSACLGYLIFSLPVLTPAILNQTLASGMLPGSKMHLAEHYCLACRCSNHWGHGRLLASRVFVAMLMHTSGCFARVLCYGHGFEWQFGLQVWQQQLGPWQHLPGRSETLHLWPSLPCSCAQWASKTSPRCTMHPIELIHKPCSILACCHDLDALVLVM